MLPPMTMTSGSRALTSEAHRAPNATHARSSSGLRAGVTLLRGTGDQAGVDLRAIRRQPRERRVGLVLQRAPDPGGRARCPDAIDSTWPDPAAAAARPIELDRDVAELAGRAARADQRPAVDDRGRRRSRSRAVR